MIPPNSKNRIKGQKQRVKGRDIPEMSNYAKIIVGIRTKGKDIMLKITVIDDEKEYSELIRQTIDNWLMEKGCQGEIDCFVMQKISRLRLKRADVMIFILWISRCRISMVWNWQLTSV